MGLRQEVLLCQGEGDQACGSWVRGLRPGPLQHGGFCEWPPLHPPVSETACRLIFLTSLLASSQELVRLLQQTVRSSQYDRYLAGPLCDGSTKGHLELLHQKDHQILGLNHQLEKLNLEKEHLQQEVAGLKSTVGELGEQLDMLMETIQAKDEVIMKLSRELSECESSWQSGSADASPPISKEQEELNKLKVRARSLPRGLSPPAHLEDALDEEESSLRRGPVRGNGGLAEAAAACWFWPLSGSRRKALSKRDGDSWGRAVVVLLSTIS